MSNGIEAKDILAVIVAIISSGMLQYLLTRHDNKKNIKGEIEKKMDEGFKEVKTEIKAEIQDVRAEIKDVKADVKDVRGDVKEVSERLEEHKATLARTHILRFADELRTGTHSKEYFEQQLPFEVRIPDDSLASPARIQQAMRDFDNGRRNYSYHELPSDIDDEDAGRVSSHRRTRRAKALV